MVLVIKFNMKFFALVNDGLEEIAKGELGKCTVHKNVLEFNQKKPLQSARRRLVTIGKGLIPPTDFTYGLFFTNNTKFKILVEGVKGQENRFKIAKEFAEKLFPLLKSRSVAPSLDLKNPDLLVVIFYNGQNYFVGIDLNITEINSRPYRVFPNPASFKGDLAYYFVRKSRYQPGEKLLSGFCKDGAIAIEAAIYAKTKVYAFDHSLPNVTAARKNSKIATIDLEVQKLSLDELDVKYKQEFFDRLIFQVAAKDESQLNELYYQSSYLLKKNGTLLLITRPSLGLTISDRFKLLEESLINRGDSAHKLWLLEKR